MGAAPSLPSLDDMTGTYTLSPEPTERSFVSADKTDTLSPQVNNNSC